jgi:hypothetical protein
MGHTLFSFYSHSILILILYQMKSISNSLTVIKVTKISYKHLSEFFLIKQNHLIYFFLIKPIGFTTFQTKKPVNCHWLFPNSSLLYIVFKDSLFFLLFRYWYNSTFVFFKNEILDFFRMKHVYKSFDFFLIFIAFTNSNDIHVW